MADLESARVDRPVENPRRPDLDRIGIRLALVWAARGTCARRRVGCTLFDVDGFQIGAGYNGPARGLPNCIATPCAGAGYASGDGLDVCEAVHAEENALIRCHAPHRIHAVYCTVSPCVSCVKKIANTGANRIVFLEAYPAHHDAARDLWLRARRSREHGDPDGKIRWTQIRATGVELELMKAAASGFPGTVA